MSLLRLSILHRHGARGPGESELSAWDEDTLIRQNWAEDEVDKLTTVGHEMGALLGSWFQQKAHAELESVTSPPRWRCSESGRGKESGFDFKNGFNSGNIKEELMMKDPVPFVKRSDYLFRPWKIYASECKNIKKSVDTSSKWTMKANENLKFLKRIFRTVDCKKSFLDSGTKMLWSTTYLIALRDCERFASVGDVNRKLITAMIPDPNDWMKLLELACWVWSERFLRSGYELEMGCNIMVDLLEDLLGVDTEQGSNHSLSVFSGHDYTILGLLGLMGACDEIQASIGFCGFALFELYRGVPPNSKLKVDAPETSEATEANVENHMGAASTSEDLYVRVKMNFQPFYDTQNNLVTVNKFHEENTVVLRDFKANDLLQLVNETKVERERKHLLDRDE